MGRGAGHHAGQVLTCNLQADDHSFTQAGKELAGRTISHGGQGLALPGRAEAESAWVEIRRAFALAGARLRIPPVPSRQIKKAFRREGHLEHSQRIRRQREAPATPLRSSGRWAIRRASRWQALVFESHLSVRQNKKGLPQGRPFLFVLAERVGFEPTDGSPHRLISSQVHSTTLPPLLSHIAARRQDYSSPSGKWKGFFYTFNSVRPPM